MNKSLRILLLFIILAVPSLVIIFLHQFGENKFDVPLQHPEGLSIKGCPDKNEGALKVPVIDSLGIEEGEFKVIFIEQGSITKAQLNDLRRVSQNHTDIDFIFLHHSPLNLKTEEYRQENWQFYKVKKYELKELNLCGFGNTNGQPFVLVDPEQHVRGYYALSKKELDRLEGELMILRDEYSSFRK
ncbi:MAG: hypothetical protein ACNS60_08795 [Candidatus Cyclobacteriaceae bacterium M2_1C_046]